MFTHSSGKWMFWEPYDNSVWLMSICNWFAWVAWVHKILAWVEFLTLFKLLAWRGFKFDLGGVGSVGQQNFEVGQKQHSLCFAPFYYISRVPYMYFFYIFLNFFFLFPYICFFAFHMLISYSTLSVSENIDIP